MFKVIIVWERDERVDVFECDSINIWKGRKVACFTFKDDGGHVESEYYEFKSYTGAYDANDYFRFWGGSLVPDPD